MPCVLTAVAQDGAVRCSFWVCWLLGTLALAEPKVGFLHTPPSEAVAGLPLKLEGSLAADSEWDVVARVRSPGEGYADVPFELAYGDLYRAVIPTERIRGTVLEYFVEVRRGNERTNVSANANKPWRVVVKGAGKSPPVDVGPRGKVIEIAPVSEPEPGPTLRKKRTEEPPPVDEVQSAKPASESQPAQAVLPPPVKRGSALEEELAVYSQEVPGAIAQRLPSGVRQSSMAPTVLTALQLRQLGVRYVYEALDLVPGLSVSRDVQGFYRVAVRGLRSEPEVLMTLNGQRLNSFYDGKSLAHLPIDNLERIEVFRGPAGVDVGLGNFLGLVNLVTRRSDGFSASVSGGLGTAIDGHLAGATHVGPVQLFADGDVATQEGPRRPVFRDGLDLPTTQREKATLDRRLLVNVGAGAALETETIGRLSVQGRFIFENRSALFGPYYSVGNDSALGWLMGQAQLQWRKPLFDDGAFELKLWFDQQSTDRLWQFAPRDYQVRANQPETVFAPGVLEQVKVGLRGGGFLAKLEAPLPLNNRLTVGLSGELQSVFEASWAQNYDVMTSAFTGEVLLPSPLRLPTSDGGGGRGPAADRLSFGVFAGDVFRPTDWLSLTAGVRFDLVQLPVADSRGTWMGSRYVPGVGPRVGISVSPIAALALKANYGRSFRPPTVQELAEQLPDSDFNAGRNVGNPRLEPANIDMIEVGVDWLQPLGEARLRLTGQAFYQRLSTPVAAIDITGNQTPYSNRAGGVQTLGAEGEARLYLSSRSVVFLNASFVRGEDLALPLTARLLTDVPQVRVNAGLALPLGPWVTFDVVVNWVSERRSLARSALELLRRYSLHAYTTVMAQLRSERLFNFLELSVTGQNVFNQEYFDDVGRVDRVPQGLPREGVFVFGTARVYF